MLPSPKEGCVPHCIQVKALEKKPSRQANLQAVLRDAVRTLLVTPFVEAAVHFRWPACKALTQAWLAYLAHIQVSYLTTPCSQFRELLCCLCNPWEANVWKHVP